MLTKRMDVNWKFPGVLHGLFPLELGMPARRAWWWNSPNQKKNALGTSYGRPVGGTEPSAFVDEGAETVRPKHLEKVREGEEEKEEEETNEMLFHHKPRPAAEGPAPVPQMC